MAIDFSKARWADVKAAHEAFWSGTLGRPLISVTEYDAHPGRTTEAPVLSQVSCADFRWTADQLIDALDAHLSRCAFHGDAFPSVSFDSFGPGVLSAFCGARLDNSSGGVWFFPERALPIDEIHVRYDPENPWVRRIKDIYRAGIERWGDSVILGMPDLGGVLDVAATFRGTEDLLMDLYDDPDEVLRLIGEIETAWVQAYQDLGAPLRAAGIDHMDWSGLISKAPSYVLQCDFSYMIGPDMFRQFALPTLQKDCKRLDHTIYHLDGTGELPHLDMVLEIPELCAVQWVQGDGQPGGKPWTAVYEKILAAGKRCQVTGSAKDYLEVRDVIGDQAYFRTGFRKGERPEGLL